MTFHKIYLIKFLIFLKLTSFYDDNFFIRFFTPCKTEQSVRGIKLKEKEIKDDNHKGEVLRKRCLIMHLSTLNIKQLRS